MTPKDKASELINEFMEYVSDVPFPFSDVENSKQCALIAIRNVREEIKIQNSHKVRNLNLDYWKKVELEIKAVK